MEEINPREWVYQGWIATRLPWKFDQEAVVRVGNSLLSHLPEMKEVYAEQNNAVSFKEYREGILRANLTLSPTNISYGIVNLDRAEEWSPYNTTVFRIICSETELFKAKYNLHQLRQSVSISLRGVSEPGKNLFQIVGNSDFVRDAFGDDVIRQIGLDQEFVFSDNKDGPINLILRFQTSGPTFVWIGAKDIHVTLSAILDPQPDIIANIERYWKEAEESLLSHLRDMIYPKIIEPLVNKLR